MVGAAIAGTVGSLAMGASASRKAGKASAQASRYAQESYDYRMEGMNNYLLGAQGMAGTAASMSYGSGSAHGYTATGGDTGGIEFAQGMLDEWEGTFGGIEDNMKEYYENLDPTKYATQSKSQYMAEMNKQMKQFNDTMAASGLQSAGMKQQAAKEQAFQLAQGNAQIDIGAEEYVADKKQGWLNYGSGFKQQATGLLGQAYATDAQTKTQASIATAGNKTNASISNSVVNAQAAAARSNAIMNEGYYINDANKAQAMFDDPRIAQSNSNAANYGKSASGWAGTAGSMLGGAMGGMGGTMSSGIGSSGGTWSPGSMSGTAGQW